MMEQPIRARGHGAIASRLTFIRQRKNQAVHVTVDHVCWYVLGSPFRRGVPVHHPTLNESKSNAKLQGLASHWDVRANRLAQGYDRKTVVRGHFLILLRSNPQPHAIGWTDYHAPLTACLQL